MRFPSTFIAASLISAMVSGTVFAASPPNDRRQETKIPSPSQPAPATRSPAPNPDIMGVTIGMGVDEARKKVLEANPEFKAETVSSTGRDESGRVIPGDAFTDRIIFEYSKKSAGGGLLIQDRVTLFIGGVKPNEYVVGIARLAGGPRGGELPVAAPLIKAYNDKYGSQPTARAEPNEFPPGSDAAVYIYEPSGTLKPRARKGDRCWIGYDNIPSEISSQCGLSLAWKVYADGLFAAVYSTAMVDDQVWLKSTRDRRAEMANRAAAKAAATTTKPPL